MMRAAAYLRAGDVEDAKKDYAGAIQQVMKTGFYSAANWYASVAWTYAILNLNAGEAFADCAEALKLDPKNGFAFNTRGFMYLRMGRYREALSDYDHALERSLAEDVAALYRLTDNRRHYALFGRGLAKIRLGDAAAGKEDLAAAEKLKPGVGAEFALYGLKV
jgi:tetratricopeptide (TPR) repeat protein